jgi:hypothetical protein
MILNSTENFKKTFFYEWCHNNQHPFTKKFYSEKVARKVSWEARRSKIHHRQKNRNAPF